MQTVKGRLLERLFCGNKICNKRITIRELAIF